VFLDDLVASLNRSIHGHPEVMDYLRSRGVSEEEVKKYGIGYSKIVKVPDDGSPDRKRFMEESWKGRKFEERVVFPIRDAMGRVIGLIGRSVSVKGFKIFATDEAKFHGMFVGLYEALPHIYKENRVFVVEGPFDFTSLAKVLPNTVSSLTADLNEAQHWLLRMYCDRIVTVFDADEAGRRAADSAAKRFETQTLDLGYGDPNDCFKKLGAGFRNHVMSKLRDIPTF
jgi:DNA primase